MSISTQALLDQWKVVESTLNSKFQAVTPFKEINVRTSIPPAHVFAGTYVTRGNGYPLNVCLNR